MVDWFVLVVCCIFIFMILVFVFFKSVVDICFFIRVIDFVKGGGEDMVDVLNRIFWNIIE